MRTTEDVRIEQLVDDLLLILDADIRQVSLTLNRLDELRGSVIKRDEEGLKSLLHVIQEEGSVYGQVELRREEIRGELANIAGCSFSEMNLSYLSCYLSCGRVEEIRSKQAELQDLTRRLKCEHLGTEMLLKECMNLNKKMLKGIFSNGSETTTYNSRGRTSWEVQQGLVNFKL